METITVDLPQMIQEPIDLAYLVSHNDPFNPNDKTMIIVPVGANCYSVLQDFTFDIEFYDLVIARNQEIVDADFIIEENDVISFSLVPKGGGGGGKSILGTIAMVALAVAAPALGAAAMSALGFGAGTVLAANGMLTAAGFLSLGINAGIMIAGGLLISSIFKPNLPTAKGVESFDQSPTYGWDAVSNTIKQGGAVPILYGTCKVVPQYIGKYIVTDNDTQYLRALLAIGEGTLDYITSVDINDLPMTNYVGVGMYQRLGTNTQDVIPYFGDTYTETGVSKKLTNTSTWHYAQTQGDAVTAIGIGITCPSGLWYANKKGGLDSYSIKIDIEYKPVTSGTWLSLPSSANYRNMIERFIGNKNYVLQAKPEAGWYDRYVYPVGASKDEWVHTGEVYLTAGDLLQMSGTSYKTLYNPRAGAVWSASRPFQQYLGDYVTISGNTTSTIRRMFKAEGIAPSQYDVRVRFYEDPNTDSKYGSTAVFEYLQEAISDDFTYPNTALIGLQIQATDQLSGSLPKVSCVASRVTGTHGRLDNPAWACLDLLTNARYGAGMSMSNIDFNSFQTWADYCTSKNYTVNMYIDQSLDLAQTLQLIGQLGRGTVMQYGSTFKAVVDMPNILPTQGFLFSMGNIIKDSFSESFLPLKDRANIIEVTYYNIDNDYQREVIEVSQGNYDLIATVNKTSINLIGCVTKEQAIKQAVYHLNQNRYLTITAEWEASIDSIQCAIGDVVNVSHDVPQWGYSGRIVANTANTITVDRDDLVMVDGKTYYIQVSNSDTDEQIYKQVLSVSGDTITITTSDLPTIGDHSVYSFGEVNRHAKKMRILSITTSGDMKRRIKAIEYNENVYSDSITVPTPIQVSDLSTYNLRASEFLEYDKTGDIQPVVDLSWYGNRLSYDVKYALASGGSYVSAGIARRNNFQIRGLKELQEYRFFVDGVEINYTVLGKTAPPPDVTNLTGVERAGWFELTWDYDYKPLDFARFKVYLNGSEIATTLDNGYRHNLITPKVQVFGVSAIDTTGNESAITTVSITPTAIPNVTGLTNYWANDSLWMKWDLVQDHRTPIDYEIRLGNTWASGLVIGNTNVNQFMATNAGDYMVKARYIYDDGSIGYSLNEAQIEIVGGVLPKNIIAVIDESATNWSGLHLNTGNIAGYLELLADDMDSCPSIDSMMIFDYMGGISSIGVYEIPTIHQVDIGYSQICRIWTEYNAFGVYTNSRVDNMTNFDSEYIDSLSDQFGFKIQMSIAGDDDIWGEWKDLIIGDHVGKKFKFRAVLYSYDQTTTVKVQSLKIFIDMPDKFQSGNSVLIDNLGTHVTYAMAFHATPNLQVTIINAEDGDDAIISNESETGFDIIVTDQTGSGVDRHINYQAKGY